MYLMSVPARVDVAGTIISLKHLPEHDLTLTISMVRRSFLQLSMCGVCYVAAEKFYEAKAGKIYIM